MENKHGASTIIDTFVTYQCPTFPSNSRLPTVIVLPIPPSIPARNVTPDAAGPTVGANCRVIIVLAMAGGAISRVVERGWKRREVAGSGDTCLPRFGVATKAAPYSCNLTISGLKPEVYRIQSESRVFYLASGAALVRLYIDSRIGLTGRKS